MMLDLGKKYYVSISNHLERVVKDWVQENGVTLGNEELTLLNYGKVCSLDVQCNKKLKEGPRKQGAQYAQLLNGTRMIGGIYYDSTMGEERVIIIPAIVDR